MVVGFINPVSSNNKTDRQDITEILLKVALNTITLTLGVFTTIKNIFGFF
jgi:hypothetical protein